MAKEIVELRRDVLASNNEGAERLRRNFTQARVSVANFISSPGSGKTSLISALAREATEQGVELAVLVGDCATDNDARRILAGGATVRQIITGGLCHLESSMIEDHLVGWDLYELDLLIIENVGNLVCPTDFDLGENLKVALISTTEGEDKPLKYPQLFSDCDVVVITKMDLAIPCDFDETALRTNLEHMHPGIQVIATSAKENSGTHDLLNYLIASQFELTASEIASGTATALASQMK